MLDRPPLESHQRTGAIVAGALALPLMTAGFEVLAIVVSVLVLASMFAILFTGFDDMETGAGTSDAAFNTTSAVVIALVVLGAALVLAVGVVASWLVLRAARVRRPIAVTWAALGVSVAPSGLIALLLYSVISAMAGGSSGTSVITDDTLLPLIIAACLNILLAAVIGALCWWWMAHALRAPAVSSTLEPVTPT